MPRSRRKRRWLWALVIGGLVLVLVVGWSR
jgi:hypothetical protein